MQEFINTFLLNFWTNPIVIFFLAIGIILSIFKSKILGWFGEHWTKEALEDLPKDKYSILNDIFIYVNGRTHQIDHVIVSPYGIFSVETKQYNGYITGSKYDKNWVRHIGKNKYYYSNPIRQNYGHVKSLVELLNIDESKIHNIVCIPSRAKLKIQHDGELVRYDTIVERILSFHDVVIDNPEEIINLIKSNNITDKKQKKEHINYIRNNVIDKDPSKCPKCGGKLVERNGKFGMFLGCSNYPKCKYTKNI